jgi:hypothetical protein
MNRLKLLPLIVLAAAACSDTATSPSARRTPQLPLAANADINGPSGAHLVTGTPQPSCAVSSDRVVACNSYEIAGVGNTNAVANLTATFSATIDCFNPGVNPNNPVESHTTTFSQTKSSGQISPKNGRLTVPPLSVSPFSAPQVCPNPNWTPVIRGGSVTVQSFTYNVTFEGFSTPFILITGP